MFNAGIRDHMFRKEIKIKCERFIHSFNNYVLSKNMVSLVLPVGDRAVKDRKSLVFYLCLSPEIPESLVKMEWNVLTCHL